MPAYKLTYFNANGLAEPIRWAFVVAGIPFEDERIEFSDWGTAKASGRYPTGNIPLLEIDGKVYTQSGAIMRYLAREYNLYTGDAIKDLIVDQVDGIVKDAFAAFARWARTRVIELYHPGSPHHIPDQTELNRLHAMNTVFPPALTQIQEILKASDGEYFGGSKLTYADLAVASWLDIWTSVIDPALPEKYPVLEKHREAVMKIPEIKTWVENRPKNTCI